MQIAVRLVEDGEVYLQRKIVEEIEQSQSGNAYAIFEHIDVMLLVESELFVDSLEERYDIAEYHTRKSRIVFIQFSLHAT